MNRNFNNAIYALPAKPGRYKWWSRFLGVTDIEWKDGWFFLTGDRVPDGVVKWWR